MRGRLKPVRSRHPHTKRGTRPLPISDDTYYKNIGINTDCSWWLPIVDYLRDAARHLGLGIDDIQWNDHTCGLKGSYRYKPNATMFVRTEFPTAPEIHRLIDDFDDAARVTKDGSVVGHLCASFSITYRGGGAVGTYVEAEPEDDEHYTDGSDWDSDPLEEAVKDFARWCHKQIMDEYEDITSKEAVADALRNNI